MLRKIAIPLVLISALMLAGCITPTVTADIPNVGGCNLVSTNKLILVSSPCNGAGQSNLFLVAGKVDAIKTIKLEVNFYANGTLLQQVIPSTLPDVSASTYKSFNQTVTLNTTIRPDTVTFTSYSSGNIVSDQLTIKL